MSEPSYALDRELFETAPASPRAWTLFTWNVLAAELGESGGFIEAPPESLPWDVRRGPILEQVLSGEHAATPDLICLQEVDRFADTFEPALREAGYVGAYVPKAHGRDGCCLAWRRERFALRWSRPLRYLDSEGRNGTQVGVLAALDDTVTGTPLLAATTHLKAKVGHEAVRAGQARQLRAVTLQERDRLGPEAGLVIAGDFNDVPGSPAHAVLVGDGRELQSAWVTCAGAEPTWTTWKIRASGEECRTIDYVFHSPALRPTAVLQPPPRDHVEAGRLPGRRYPSDHLSLLVRFEWS